MAKKKRKYNPNLVRSRRSYTLEEIAEIYTLHIRTVQDWHINGLKSIDPNRKPLLVLGEEIRRYLKQKSQKRKHKLIRMNFLA